jgi:SNF2 family DNA or RNA helicase
VLIISYDLLRLKATDQFTSMAQTFKLLIVDEGHRLKNTAGSLTLTALESIPCDARLCVTATPIQNNLSEFYTLANFCRPGCLGDLQSFRRDFERPISASSGSNASQEQRRLGAVQAKELDKITQTFMLRRLQKDILSTMLPPRSEFLLFCIPSIEQCELYRSIVNESQGESAESLTKLTALRKLCLHPCLLDQTTVSHANADIAQSGKLVVLEALLVMIRTQCPHDKVVLVSSYTSALTVVESVVLQPRQLSYVRLDGTTDVQSRQPLVDSFNRSSPDQQFCLLLSSKAGGVGLNLVGANRLIMLDADWNPAFCIQAMGRIYRQGQTKSTFIYRFFTSGTIEEVIYQRQSAKGNLADMAVDGKTASSTKGFTKEELADCFTLKDGCPCDTKRKLGSRWPDYTGTESLDASDTVLIELGKQMKESIGHVHVVKDEELALAVDSLDTESPHQESLYDTDTDDDEELEFE